MSPRAANQSKNCWQILGRDRYTGLAPSFFDLNEKKEGDAMKNTILVLTLCMLGLGTSLAAEPCHGCDIAADARHRVVGKSGVPESNVACFYISMPDQCNSIEVEADGRGFEHKHVRSYPIGSAVAMVSQSQFTRANGVPICRGGEKAMVCVPISLRTTVTTLRLIPGNKGTCNEIRGDDLADLWRIRTIPATDPTRLGWPTLE